MISAIEASKKAVGISFEIFLILEGTGTDDLGMKLKNVFVLDDPNVICPYIPFQDDDTERLVEMCPLEKYLLENATGNDEVIIIADTRHIQGGVRTKDCSHVVQRKPRFLQ